MLALPKILVDYNIISLRMILKKKNYIIIVYFYAMLKEIIWLPLEPKKYCVCTCVCVSMCVCVNLRISVCVHY